MEVAKICYLFKFLLIQNKVVSSRNNRMSYARHATIREVEGPTLYCLARITSKTCIKWKHNDDVAPVHLPIHFCHNLNYRSKFGWSLIVWANYERFHANLILTLHTKSRVKINIFQKRIVKKNPFTMQNTNVIRISCNLYFKYYCMW
jgi:hypothetical protein